ncbi:hypothetical protein [Streptomyces sp. NPDC021622]|uniref:hypothetical protein n=1 Tax=Streptomyces sp. NPDC021622 TaxID=3155013 RepID=UPI0033C420F9
MIMTEPFAAAVATVAPVLILVGSVELAALGVAEQETWKAELRAASASAELVEGLGESQPSWVRQEIQRRELQPGAQDKWRKSAQLFLYFVWFALSMALLVAFMLSLDWLAAPEPDSAPQLARFCFGVLFLGFLMVAEAPLARSAMKEWAHKRQMSERARSVRVFMESTAALEMQGSQSSPSPNP